MERTIEESFGYLKETNKATIKREFSSLAGLIAFLADKTGCPACDIDEYLFHHCNGCNAERDEL